MVHGLGGPRRTARGLPRPLRLLHSHAAIGLARAASRHEPRSDDAHRMTTPPSDNTATTRRAFVQAAGALTAVAILPDLAFARVRRAGPTISVGLIGAGRQGRLTLA